ncbi:ATP-binding cassette domain-containing protein [Arthrobacter sp. Helios]|uniref:ATP-binding cassette domain-containing protein n=1 Tax=Arthrobacter sp. Helios TaxID=2828862 RepID=UPI0020623F4B|nr:ATP-binding cassette domain-containing protein [Arthrobacter sp. Helios]UPO77729.1 AAA family ATPase [Arthrobacter sp. Helios]
MQPVITAEGLSLSAARGRVYGPLSFDVPDPLSVFCGPAGSGRTSLLLTLAGRMKAGSGTLKVLGHALPREARAVQKETAIAGFAGIDELEPGVTVGQAVRERMAWLAPWWTFVPKTTDRQVSRVCGPVFGGRHIPPASAVIWNLDEADQFLLRISLALLSGPRILFVDDIEQVHSAGARRLVWERLAAIAADGTAVVVGAASQDSGLWENLDPQPSALLLTQEVN